MPQMLHAPRHFAFHLPKFSSAGIGILEFLICGAVVVALAVGLLIAFPLGADKTGDDGTYLAQLQH
jgi:hypothetical protein